MTDDRANERQYYRLALPVVATTMLLLGACSERNSAQSAAPPQSQASAPTASQDEPPSVAEEPGSVVKGAVAPGGVAATYQAHFHDGQLQRIGEQRKSADGSAHTGEYEFYGARLTGYRGDALQSTARIELKFDMHGALTASSSNAGNISDEEINAIRTRAGVLRSHAVARKGIQGHGG